MAWANGVLQQSLSRFAIGCSFLLSHSLATPSLASGLSWKEVNTPQSAPRWTETQNPSSSATGYNQSLTWTTTSTVPATRSEKISRNSRTIASGVDTQTSDEREQPTQTSQPSKPATGKSLPIVSIGAGVRTASQDNTQAVIQGAVRLFNTGDRTLSSVSARPALIFPPSDCNSCDAEYRIAATIDFFQYDILSFYIGGGGAFNKDGVAGNNFGMFSGGVELNLARNFAITGNLNLIDEPSDAQFGGLTWADAETSILFTVRF